MGGGLSQAVKGFDDSEVDDFIENVHINAIGHFSVAGYRISISLGFSLWFVVRDAGEKGFLPCLLAVL